MRFSPPVVVTRNARGTRLAYQVLGHGPLDLVFLLGWPSNLALIWEIPAFVDFLHGLPSFCRLILFDQAGNGLSDRGPARWSWTATTSAVSPCTSPRACWRLRERPRCSAREPCASSGFRFTPRGSHLPKGVPDEWQLFAATITAW